jgi:hypothetical protein
MSIIDLVSATAYRCRSGQYDPATGASHPPVGAKMWRGLIGERTYPSGFSSGTAVAAVKTPFGACVAFVQSFQGWCTVHPVPMNRGRLGEFARVCARASKAQILAESSRYVAGRGYDAALINVAAEDEAEAQKTRRRRLLEEWTIRTTGVRVVRGKRS